jgi:hypothetical protein
VCQALFELKELLARIATQSDGDVIEALHRSVDCQGESDAKQSATASGRSAQAVPSAPSQTDMATPARGGQKVRKKAVGPDASGADRSAPRRRRRHGDGR